MIAVLIRRLFQMLVGGSYPYFTTETSWFDIVQIKKIFYYVFHFASVFDFTKLVILKQ